MTTVLETCGISPPPPSSRYLSASSTSFGSISTPSAASFFYNHPCSEAEFSNTIVPNLKHTLSLPLQHFLPVAGNLLYPLHTGNFRPLIRYVSGDSAQLTIAVSGRDFDELTGSHIRESDLLPPVAEERNYKIAPLAAMQVTLFPCRGICVGLSNHHCLGDARSVPRFISAQAEMSIHNGDKQYLSCSSSLLFDKSVLGDANGADEKYWSERDHIVLRAATELFLPLFFFDMTWLHFNPIRRVIFYNHPCSEAEFFNTIVPNLKHYLPVATNLLYPLHTDASKPAFRYISGDFIPLTIAVSSLDFDELVANNAKESDQLYAGAGDPAG
ncbi:hypothetical protein SASPL_157934 [Salvia splendens]|uniref:Uncharacterized protein n=1 Tax=Salvia splendens TaxID=180675 RepID=A0A8X8VU38_SALSN|nr:hypothetical protein SASPL_157934 [Salvia splendens]